MIPLVSIVLLAASTNLEIVNEVYHLPPTEWRYIELGLKQQAAMVSARYETVSGSKEVRVALIRHDDLEKLRNGLPHGVIAATPLGARGSVNYHVGVPGDYVLVIDNLARSSASVHLRVNLDFSRPGPEVTQLSPRRQLTIVLISFVVFFGIVSWSARKLLHAVKKPTA
jgi:hypothetical protein